MRRPVDSQLVWELLRQLGEASLGPGVVYITGGCTALLLGFRNQTVDVDLKLEPEPAGAFSAIARLKERLGLNVELAAPDDFIPALPGWQERSRWIGRFGEVEFRHYDFYSQTLAKVERGLETDLKDAHAFIQRGLVEPGELERLFGAIEPELVRYPAVDSKRFRARLTGFLAAGGSNEDG